MKSKSYRFSSVCFRSQFQSGFCLQPSFFSTSMATPKKKRDVEQMEIQSDDDDDCDDDYEDSSSQCEEDEDVNMCGVSNVRLSHFDLLSSRNYFCRQVIKERSC